MAWDGQEDLLALAQYLFKTSVTKVNHEEIS
jgi:hypothetical protein